MLVVTPRKEEPVALPRRFGLKAGRAYLFRERRPKLVFLALAEAVRHGSIGLIVTRRAPIEVREDYDLPATAIIWLTSSLGQNRLAPMPPETLERAVRDFVAAQPTAVIALEGVEYLANYVGTERLVRCLPILRDPAASRGGAPPVSPRPPALQAPGTS